jgi:hypothetical protein
MRKLLALCAVVIALLSGWLAFDRGYFNDFSAGWIQNKSAFTNAPKNAEAASVLHSINGNSSAHAARAATPFGDWWNALGKPADIEVCGFGVQHVEEFPMGISLPPVTASNETLLSARWAYIYKLN